jgi:N-acetylglucosaminyldiphosphoundecaprenol N-acetyl-beta-D-mannosaminyltransferase
MTRRVSIFNASFDPLTRDETVQAIFRAIDAGRRGWLCTVNVSTLMMMREDPWLQGFVDRAALVVADGQPLVWCAPLFGGSLPERVTGIDLIDALCTRAAAEHRGIYCLGASAPLLRSTIARLRARHPGLRIDGADGYFDDDSAAARAEQVRASGAQVLLVGMGCPRQEAFIDAHWARLGVGMAIGVGGSFDVLGGARYRAHRWIGQLGFEWLVRLLQEPRRLARRYLVTNTGFCLLIGKVLLARAKRLATGQGPRE